MCVYIYIYICMCVRVCVSDVCVCVCVCVYVCGCVKKQQFCSLRTQKYLIILTKQHAQTSNHH